MLNLTWPFLISLVITITTTPLAILFAKKYKLVDDPKKRPHPAHVQNRVVPRAGGIAIFLGILISIIIFIPLTKPLLGIIFGLIILLLIGLIDDATEKLSPYPRLLLQFIAAGLVVASGIGITFITNPLGGILRLDEIITPIEIFGQAHNIVLLADIFAIVWIVWMMNMVNWSKGVDGQMPGIAGVAAITIGLLSFRLFSEGDPNQLPIALMSFITAGSSLGFLIFNWYPAKIFPGFSGSNILGFMIAVLAILSGAKLATALLVLLIPAVDFIYTFIRRLATKKSPFLGDQLHLHHLLLKRGWTHRQISLLYIFSCAILGILSTALNSQGKLFALAFLSVVIAGSILWLHLFTKAAKEDGI